jgi:hypothetical protein
MPYRVAAIDECSGYLPDSEPRELESRESVEMSNSERGKFNGPVPWWSTTSARIAAMGVAIALLLSAGAAGILNLSTRGIPSRHGVLVTFDWSHRNRVETTFAQLVAHDHRCTLHSQRFIFGQSGSQANIKRFKIDHFKQSVGKATRLWWFACHSLTSQETSFIRVHSDSFSLRQVADLSRFEWAPFGPSLPS